MESQSAKNPYNLRGALITPSGNQSHHYYLILIDVDPSSIINEGSFSFANPNENQTTLTYNFDNGNLILPTIGNTKTIMLPVYLNQQLKQPNQEGDNMFVTVSIGGSIISRGYANILHPPIVEIVDREVPLKCTTAIFFSGSSTNANNYFLMVVVNSDVCIASNPLGFSSYGGDPNFNMNALVGMGTQPYNGVIACIGAFSCDNFGLFSNAWASGTNPSNGEQIVGPMIPFVWDWTKIHTI